MHSKIISNLQKQKQLTTVQAPISFYRRRYSQKQSCSFKKSQFTTIQNKRLLTSYNLRNSGLKKLKNNILYHLSLSFINSILINNKRVLNQFKLSVSNFCFYKIIKNLHVDKMALFSKQLIFLFILAFFIFDSETKAKISRIDNSNFQKFKNDGSYWIIQISNSPCPQCQKQQKQLSDTAELLEGVCKIGKVDAKFLQGMQIPSNPTYLFLRSDNIQDNVQFTQNPTKTNFAKFCLQEVQKAVKKRHKELFGSSKNNQESTGSSKQSNKNYDGTKIIELNDQSFQKTVLQSKQAWFVLFYSPSCGHCRSLQPQFEKLPGLMGKKVNIARIDASVNSKMAQKYQIKGFPTMFLFESDNKEKSISYEGQRTAEQIKSWLSNKKLNKAVKQLHQLNKKNYEWNCNKNIVCLIFILNSKSEKSSIRFIKPLLEQTIDKPIQFFYSERIPVLEGLLMIEDKATPKMVATWQGINSYRIYNGANNEDDLRQFIDHIMERRKWIKFEQKSTDLIFSPNQQL